MISQGRPKALLSSVCSRDYKVDFQQKKSTIPCSDCSAEGLSV
uniref:Uncharacterized protein n=1 Tax=Anguilla anguilla TaxID=7936 RepID=A0A0E9TZ33_ANGAN